MIEIVLFLETLHEELLNKITSNRYPLSNPKLFASNSSFVRIYTKPLVEDSMLPLDDILLDYYSDGALSSP